MVYTAPLNKRATCASALPITTSCAGDPEKEEMRLLFRKAGAKVLHFFELHKYFNKKVNLSTLFLLKKAQIGVRDRSFGAFFTP